MIGTNNVEKYCRFLVSLVFCVTSASLSQGQETDSLRRWLLIQSEMIEYSPSTMTEVGRQLAYIRGVLDGKPEFTKGATLRECLTEFGIKFYKFISPGSAIGSYYAKYVGTDSSGHLFVIEDPLQCVNNIIKGRKEIDSSTFVRAVRVYEALSFSDPDIAFITEYDSSLFNSPLDFETVNKTRYDREQNLNLSKVFKERVEGGIEVWRVHYQLKCHEFIVNKSMLWRLPR